MEKIELLLHPVRMRVILAVANRTLTAQQLAALLSDVAQTTLYRQINLLLEGGILRVVRETKVRGTIERELTLVEGAARLDLEASLGLPAEQQEQLFTLFIGSLLTEYQRAVSLSQSGIPPAIYQRNRLFMSFDDLQAVNKQIEALLAPYNTPSSEALPGWLFTGIVMPDADTPNLNEDE